MEHFITKHADKIRGSLSCFDRILFRGYLPFFSGAAMAAFIDRRGVRRPELWMSLGRAGAGGGGVAQIPDPEAPCHTKKSLDLVLPLLVVHQRHPPA